ncbi:uncharacterized protein M6B38_351720 [Iris pallida]|uniref:Plant-specific domain TIGR01615 family protein n=1 Tax=Iris pallida TaxID=29817 RepID=A0AAX6GRR9_IRIPA|nr:uncharacterized protein M6B38_351720 [Iris pallida]
MRAATIEKVEMSKTLSDMEFFDLLEFDQAGYSIDRGNDDDNDDDDEEEGPTESSIAESKTYWEEQRLLLQSALSRSSPTETRLRSDTEEAIARMRSAGTVCSCSKEPCCRDCMLRDVADRLRGAGCDTSVCISKWRRSPDVPSGTILSMPDFGEHRYVDAVEAQNGGKSPSSRVVIELNLRAEFEMARGNGEYNSLVSRLPEMFVGKPERLRRVIKIMCSAAKRCMKENKMHIAPWRKHKYMLAKWFSASCERMLPPPPCQPQLIPTMGYTDRQAPTRPRASMLTFDLRCAAVEVVR